MTTQYTQGPQRKRRLDIATPSTDMSSCPSPDSRIVVAPAPHQRDLAVSFFLGYLNIAGRSLESSRGFLEYINPILANEKPDSVLAAAVDAASTTLWAQLRHESIPEAEQHQLSHRAVVRLQNAISGAEHQSHNATVAAALVLQLHDTLSALFTQQRATGIHRSGALALLAQRIDMKNTKYETELLANLLHYKVSLCVRTWKALPPHEIEWLKNEVIPILPARPSSHLDLIGVSVASLQHSFTQLDSSNPVMLSQLVMDVSDVGDQLDVWLDAVPEHWYPSHIENTKAMDCYRGACDVYPSIQVATIWNAWRIYRLIIESIKGQLGLMRNDDISQQLVDDICYSIPFYVGNLNSPISFAILEDPSVDFPSYYDLPPTERAFQRYQFSEDYATKVDHLRHAFLQGPFHAMNMLMHLLGLVVGDATISLEQKGWISAQYLRSLYLLRVIPQKPLDKPSPSSYSDEMKLAEAMTFVEMVKQKLWTVHVL
jgi:hypothetical protein